MKGILERTVGTDQCFNILKTGSHLPSQVTLGNSNVYSYALVNGVIGSWKSKNVLNLSFILTDNIPLNIWYMYPHKNYFWNNHLLL